MDEEKQSLEGQGPGRCGGKAELGPKCPGDVRFSGCGQPVGRKRQLDLGLGKRLPRPAGGRDGRSPAHARKSSGRGKSKIKPAAESGKQDSRKQERDCD